MLMSSRHHRPVPTDLTWVLLTPLDKMGKECRLDGNLGLDNPMGVAILSVLVTCRRGGRLSNVDENDKHVHRILPLVPASRAPVPHFLPTSPLSGFGRKIRWAMMTTIPGRRSVEEANRPRKCYFQTSRTQKKCHV